MLVRVFINFNDLFDVYQSLKIVNNDNTIRKFMIDFVQIQNFFDVIDVNKEEKIMNHKIKNT